MINTDHWSERWPDHPVIGTYAPGPSASTWDERCARFFESRVVSRWILGGFPTHLTIVSTAKNPAKSAEACADSMYESCDWKAGAADACHTGASPDR